VPGEVGFFDIGFLAGRGGTHVGVVGLNIKNSEKATIKLTNPTSSRW
jgi:hypothetical protein